MTAQTGMSRQEAAHILADYVIVRARARNLEHELEDAVRSGFGATLIAECISEARHEKPAGTYLHTAGTIRPADRTIRAALRRKMGATL